MKHVSETSQQPENSQPVAKATAGTAGTAEPAKKLTKKEKRRRAQRKQLLTVLAIAAVAAVIIGAVFAYTKWQDNRVATLPQDQRITAVVNGEETELAPYRACELDDKDCQNGEPVTLDTAGASEITLKLPKDVYDHDWAMLKIFDDPGANEEKYYKADEAKEVTIPLESEQTTAENAKPKLAVLEIHSMLVGLDSNGDQTPYNVVWSIAPSQ